MAWQLPQKTLCGACVLLRKRAAVFPAHGWLRRLLMTKAAEQYVAVVGAGPAGFYVAQQIKKRAPNCGVHLYESLPAPYGLVRFGVAPDHPEVKNVTSTFTQTARLPGVRLLADVEVGRHLRLAELRRAYDAVVLAYGAEEDRALEIPGASLSNVASARRLVAWYNGVPGAPPPVDLSVESAVIIGMGNVALDVLRLLTAEPDSLRNTDITESALQALAESRVRHVTVVGRRGPLQAAFTIKELREQIHLQGAAGRWDGYPYRALEPLLPELPRARRRLTELMVKTAAAPAATGRRTWQLKFLRRPLEALGRSSVQSLRLGVNRLADDRLVETGETEVVPCQLLLSSIGYKGRTLAPQLPFDEDRGVIKNTAGRVTGLPGVYATGWIATGPVGVIVNTMNSSFAVGKVVAEDLAAGVANPRDLHPDDLVQALRDRGCRPVGFDDWLRLEAEEERRGQRAGKPREKIVCVKEMRRVIWGE